MFDVLSDRKLARLMQLQVVNFVVSDSESSGTTSIRPMKPRVFIRDLSDHEQQALEDALGADHAFTRRRARVLRFSAF
jgi:hypothetical protein